VSRNPKAGWALVTALAALGVLLGGLAAAHYSGDVGLYEAIPAIPIGLVLAFVSVRLARRARLDHDRSLGRIGGRGIATAARILGGLALILAITGVLALGVFAVLSYAAE
jgi:hypothetical protein